MFLYVITNVVTSKQYVGITTKTVKDRFREHRLAATKKGRRTPLYTSMRKHGRDAFVIETIARYSSFEDLLQAERETIAARGTLVPKGYNVVEGGKGSHGHKVSDETRRRMSAKRMGVAPWNKGGHHSQETRDKLSRVRATPEKKAKLAAFRREWWKQQRADIGENADSYFLGSQSTRDKLSAMRRQWWADRKAQLGEHAADFLKGRGPRPHPGHPASAEAKAKMSASTREWWAKRKAALGDDAAADFLRTQSSREKKRAARRRQTLTKQSGAEGAPSTLNFHRHGEVDT